MSNTKSIANNNSDLVQGSCPINQSEDFDMAIDKDELIAMAKKSIESAEFDFDKNPISETCRFLSLKNIVVAEQSDHNNDSKEITDIVEKVFDDYLANEISKREKTLLEKKVVKKKDFGKPILTNVPREDAIAAAKKIASDYIYSTKWVEHRDPAAEYKKLQDLESQARDEVIRLYGLDDELLDTVSSEFKEFYKYHPTIFFPTKPSERTCDAEDIVYSVKKTARGRLNALFKFQENEDPADAYARLKSIESQVKNEVASLYGQNDELLDAVSSVFDEFCEVYRYAFVTCDKEPQEITDPVCASEDTDEKEEAIELTCSTEDTDAKPEESHEEELTEITDALTPDKKAANVTEIADECVKNIRFGPGEGELVDLLRVVDAERKAASRVYELYGEDRDAIEELSKFFKRCYEAVERFHYCGFKEKALVMPEPADMPKILDGIYDSINRIVKECMSGTELEYNDGSDYDATLIKNVEHDIKSKVTEIFGDNMEIQSFANDIFRDRLAGAPKVENTTVHSESLGKENCSMVRHVVITDEEKVAVANKIAYDCVNKISFNHNEGEAIELLRMFEAEREATSKVVEVYGDDKVALNAIHDIFNCLYENIKQFYEGEPKEAGMVRIDDPTHEEKVEDITKIVKEHVEKSHFDPKGDLVSNSIRMSEARYSAKEEVKELYRDDADALKIMDDLFEKYDSLLMKCHKEKVNDNQTTEETTETPTKDKYDLSPEDAEKVNQSIERIKTKAGINTETSESLTKDKIKQLVRSKTEEVFGIGNEDAINAVWSIFDRNPYCPIREEDLEILIKRAILCYIAKEAVDYSGLSISENKSDEQIHIFEARKEAIEKAKEIYGDDKELLDYVEKVVNLYSDFITNQKFYKEEKKHNRPMPIITKPIGRRIPGMSHIVQQRPLSTTENMDNILLSKEEQKQLKAAESDALKRDSMVDYSDPSGKDIENLITKIYGERSRKNLPKESQEQCEQKDNTAFFGTTMSVGLARRIWKKQQCDRSGANLVEQLLDDFFPDKVYKRPYKYGAVVIDEIPKYSLTESCYETNTKIGHFCDVIRYYKDWIDNYYGQDVNRDESDLKFSIHRVHPEPDKYDYVVIENSHSTRPLSFPTKDMADNFLIVFRDLIEASGNLI